MRRYAPSVADDMLLWGVVPEMATLHELRTVYDFDDLMDMREVANLRAAVQALPPRPADKAPSRRR